MVGLRDRRREPRGRGERGTRGSCFMGIELKFGKMKNILEARRVAWLHNAMNVLNTLN